MAVGAAPTQSAFAALAERLRGVRVGLREDLQAARHLFRGVAAYVISDPLTFQSHRFDVQDYQVLCALRSDRPLSDIFDDLVERHVLTRDGEEAFYQFVFSLHRMGFLNLPVSDEKILYARYRQRQRIKARQRVLGWLFLQVPLINPDALLGRTIHLARPLFSRLFFVLWLGLVGAAGYIVAQRWHEFHEPLNGILATGNLPLIWITLILLKAMHEFGHAYACKHYGLHVPEMGVYLIALTPCAYVDASAAWSLTSRWQRIVIGLAGMYVESIAAAIAVFVWATADSPDVRALAYNVIFLAGAVTVLFNVNPLMRYDGYYILSDLVEIPNLRQRSTQHVLSLLKRFVVGVPILDDERTWWHRAILTSFGICASLYRVLVMIGIAAMIATKLFMVGVVVGAAMLLKVFGGAAVGAIRYLWRSEETAPVRLRAIGVSLILLVGVPLGVAHIPITTGVEARAVMVTRDQATIHAEVAGFIERIEVQPGDEVAAGQPLLVLADDAVAEQYARAESRLEAAMIRHDALVVEDPAAAAEVAMELQQLERDLHFATTKRDALVIRAPRAGSVVQSPPPGDTGRYATRGEPLVVLAAGPWQVKALIRETEFSVAEVKSGDRVEFRPQSAADRPLHGHVTSVVPAGLRELAPSPLTHAGGGSIVVDPLTGRTKVPYFQIVATLDVPDAAFTATNLTGAIRFGAERTPIGLHLYRRLLRFADLLRQG